MVRPDMQRPHVHLNLAATADGKIDTFERGGASISSPRDWDRVDRLRAESDAVMVGGRTLHAEDPGLTVRSAALRAERKGRGLPENPTKVSVSTSLRLLPGCQFLTAGPARVLLFTTPRTSSLALQQLRAAGAEVFVHDADHVDLLRLLDTVAREGVQRLLVEGGATLNFELLRLGVVDDLTLYIAPLIFGGEAAPTPFGGPGLTAQSAIPMRLISADPWDDGGVLFHYRTLSRD
jgi:2,5-diamino-6-(ribosylamino)-4(3H)-pyrimidinone 5'-phosphate reductase